MFSQQARAVDIKNSHTAAGETTGEPLARGVECHGARDVAGRVEVEQLGQRVQVPNTDTPVRGDRGQVTADWVEGYGVDGVCVGAHQGRVAAAGHV